MSTPQERNKAAVARMFAAFTAQDIPAVLEDMSEEVAWEQFELPTSAQEAGVPTLAARHGGGLPFFETLAEAVDITKFEVGRILAVEDLVFSYIQVRATVKKTAEELVFYCIQVRATVKKTGKSYETTVLLEWTFNEEGKVVGFRHHCDTGAVLQAWTA